MFSNYFNFCFVRRGDSIDSKGGAEEDNARNERVHVYSPTPTKKPRPSLTSAHSPSKRSRASLGSINVHDGNTSDPYEICPYATFK